jgi:hypothetical protein
MAALSPITLNHLSQLASHQRSRPAQDHSKGGLKPASAFRSPGRPVTTTIARAIKESNYAFGITRRTLRVSKKNLGLSVSFC